MDWSDLFEFLGCLGHVIFLFIMSGIVVTVMTALCKVIYTMIW